MKNSTLKVFSVIRNVESFVKKNKDVDLFKCCHMIQFNKSAKFYIENSKRMFSEIENGYYTLKELAIYLLYRNMMGESRISLYKIKPENIKETMKLFTKKRIQEDLKLISIIHKEFKFKGLNDYFDIKEDGTNIAFDLVRKGRISPVFFIKNFEKVLTNRQKDVIINKEYEQFKKIAKKIKETLKGGS